MASLDDILAQAENPSFVRVSTARILLRQDMLARHAELDAALNKALEDDGRHNRPAESPRLKDEIQALEVGIEAAKVEFRFRSIGKRAWADLLAAHPPTKPQRTADPRIDHNPRTFPVAAIAASCVDPAMTVDDVKRLDVALPPTLFDVLWARCIDANVGGAESPKSMAAGVIARLSERSASTPAPAASPVPSSSDE